ncbi:MAG TPA: TlpA disulfide reductase family protein [Nitrospirota bacterium]|nr:TlpA disulfide reductase family protein [Nitrospirota bacterium]
MKIILAVIISATLFSLHSCKREEIPLPVTGNKAPSFTLKDIHGKQVRLSDFSGRVVVIDFWATWCGPCKESTAELEKLHRRYQDRGVVILGISMDSGGGAMQQVKGFAEKNNLAYPMLMDNGKASTSYAVYNIPVTYVLDKNHVIVKTYKGYMPGLGDRITEQIEKLL